MEQLIRQILAQRFFVYLIAVVLLLAGLLAWQRLPIDAFPDVTNTQVTVLIKAEGLSSLDVEQRVTFPVEQKMGGLPRVRQVRSISKSGIAQVIVIFDDGVDIYFARQLVLERVQEAREEMPPGIVPELAPITTGLGEIFQYSLESASRTPTDLRVLQDWVVAPQLRPLAGVTEVNSFGGYLKEYHVLVHPDRLQKYGVALRDVQKGLEDNNTNAPGKFVVQGWEQMNVRSLGLLASSTDLGNIVLKAVNGVPVRIGDVADIEISHASRQGAVTRDGRGEVVAGMVIMLKDANSKEVVERVKNTLPRLRQTLPDDVSLNVFYDRTSLIQACIKTVVDATVHGGCWVVLVLFLFLAELRTALIVVLSIPFTFLASFIIMERAHIASNLMSLGGLAFSVGMVADASIVVIENARRHLAAWTPGASRRRLIADAVTEIARPLIFSVFIIVIVLVPLFTLEGMEGKMFGPLALTMLISLLASLAVAFFIVPVLGGSLLPVGPEHEFRAVQWIHALYGYCLALALRWSKITLLIGVAVLLGLGSVARFIGTEFMPPLDEGAIAINAVRLPNASLDGAVKVSTEIERLLRTIPEIESVVSKTGRAEISEDPMGPEQTDLIIALKPREQVPGGGRTKEAVTEAVRVELAKIPGLRYSFSQPIALRVNELISGIKSDVAVKIFGDDLDVLSRFSARVADVVGRIPGAADVKAAHLSAMTQLDVEVDRKAASQFGINVAEVNELIETAVGGRAATTMIEGQRRFAVVVRYPEELRRDVAAIGRLQVAAPDGKLVPLEQIVSFRKVEVPIEVARENGMRRVVVETNIRGRDLGGFVAELRTQLDPLVKELPKGYFIDYGGQFENQQRAMARLTIVVPMALLLIVVLLVMALGNLRDSLLVMLNLPFALVGGIVGLYWFGMTLSVSAAVAFIVLLGVAVQNGVLLIAFFRQLIEAGKPLSEAIKEGCARRFRPLMMTALTTFISHVPMLIATGAGADIQKPLAVVVNFGLVTSTFLTLLLLPIVFGWVEGWLNPAVAHGTLNETTGD